MAITTSTHSSQMRIALQISVRFYTNGTWQEVDDTIYMQTYYGQTTEEIFGTKWVKSKAHTWKAKP